MKKSHDLGLYYTHSRASSNNHPLVDMIEKPSLKLRALLFDEPVGANISPYRLAFADPIPRNPEFADHHKEPAPIVTDKIKDAIEEDVRQSCEFLPAQIETSSGIAPYWLMHSLNSHDVIDEAKAEFKTLRSGRIAWIDKFVLDYDKLSRVEKKDRMLFQLGRSSVVWLWHEDVVKKVKETGATGIRFFPVDDYSQDAVFSP